MSLLETLDLLRTFHRKAPFLFFNGNTFATISRTIVDTIFADLPTGRRREAASLAAHFVAGVLDRETMAAGIEALCEVAEFRPGDRVRTLRGSLHGTVKRVIEDGRVAWQPDNGGAELVALPESLLMEAGR